MFNYQRVLNIFSIQNLRAFVMLWQKGQGNPHSMLCTSTHVFSTAMSWHMCYSCWKDQTLCLVSQHNYCNLPVLNPYQCVMHSAAMSGYWRIVNKQGDGIPNLRSCKTSLQIGWCKPKSSRQGAQGFWPPCGWFCNIGEPMGFKTKTVWFGRFRGTPISRNLHVKVYAIFQTDATAIFLLESWRNLICGTVSLSTNNQHWLSQCCNQICDTNHGSAVGQGLPQASTPIIHLIILLPISPICGIRRFWTNKNT